MKLLMSCIVSFFLLIQLQVQAQNDRDRLRNNQVRRIPTLTNSGENNSIIFRDATGGFAQADIINNYTSGILGKHVANIKFTALHLKPKFPLEKSLVTLLNQNFSNDVSFANQLYLINGTAFSTYNQINRKLDFTDAYITEFFFPGADVSARDSRLVTIVVEKGKMREKYGDVGERTTSRSGNDLWQASNFSFVISGLEGLRILKVDTFRIKRKVPEDQIGIFREPAKQSTQLLTPNIRVTISDENVQPLIDWYLDWFISGNHRQQNEKQATLSMFSANRSNKLLEFKFKGVGLSKMERTSEGFIVELYFEGSEISSQ